MLSTITNGAKFAQTISLRNFEIPPKIENYGVFQKTKFHV
jgi:hypothetical protein